MDSRSLISKIKSEIKEISIAKAHEMTSSDTVFLDVREPDEFNQGFIPNAVYIPRGRLEMNIEDEVADKDKHIIVYCAGGVRSALAARSLIELGYTNVESMSGGFNAWKNAGFEWNIDKLNELAQSSRYSRHIAIPEVGIDGQKKLLESKVLLVGAGGLGSPAALYLAAAGIGMLGLIDNDVVDESNLQRQIMHRTYDIGRKKIESGRETLKAINPDVNVIGYDVHLDSSNIEEILSKGWDVVLNGCDNFPTRYLINDACYWNKIPLVDGSIFRFEGQVNVYIADKGPCYRCLYPEPPPPELAPSCAEAGVLGVMPGIIGTMQALETIKLLLQIGELLTGRIAHFDALNNHWKNYKVNKDPDCVLCGANPSITEYIDYAFFCSSQRKG